LSEDRRTQINVYGPTRRIWKDFMRICKREGSSASEKLSAYIEQYVIVHAPGNPQTLMPSFAENGVVSLENLEGRLRQQCVDHAAKYRHIKLSEITQKGTDMGLSVKQAKAMTDRTQRWLREVMMVKVYNQ